MLLYLNGAYLHEHEAAISPLDRGFLFGDGVYEVVRFYDGAPLALEAHMNRLRTSLEGIRMEANLADPLTAVCERLIEANGLTNTDAVVYMQVTRGATARSHAFPAPEVPPTVFAQAWALNINAAQYETGVPVITVPDTRWARCYIKSVNLLPNILAKQEARDAGAFEAVFVRDGIVIEGSSTNLFAVIDGTVLTHPQSPYMLPGITRALVLGLCRDLGLPLAEQPLSQHQFMQADELFIASTTAEVLPVVRVDETVIGSGFPGPVTRQLRSAFKRLIPEALVAHD